MRFHEAIIIFEQTLHEHALAYTSLIAKDFLLKANIVILEHLDARLVEQLELIVVGDQVWARVRPTPRLLLRVKAAYDCFVADSTH